MLGHAAAFSDPSPGGDSVTAQQALAAKEPRERVAMRTVPWGKAISQAEYHARSVSNPLIQGRGNRGWVFMRVVA